MFITERIMILQNLRTYVKHHAIKIIFFIRAMEFMQRSSLIYAETSEFRCLHIGSFIFRKFFSGTRGKVHLF